ncbi:MAG: alcohol dehydrogenase, partial [Mycobacteriales bacterium]
MDVLAYASLSAKAPFERITVQRREVGPRDVLIEIRAAGICHSDIHTGRDEWG